MELHGREHGGVGVGHAFFEILEKRFVRRFTKFPRGGEVAGAEGDACLLLRAGLEGGLITQPPDSPVEDDAKGEEKGAEDGPHDPAAFDECFDDDIGKHGGVS